VDLTAAEDFGSDEQVDRLAAWLVRNQPISTAMNTTGNDLKYALRLFEKTGQVVYTIGREGAPALTCQARPQEGEIFGEFPVRKEMGKYTRFPVVIPSPTPGYNAYYSLSYLEKKAADPSPVAGAHALLELLESKASRGYCIEVLEYIQDACGVRRGDGSATGGPNRTILFGLQRPPMNDQVTALRCSAHTTLDELAPSLLPFMVTNAWMAVEVSVDPSNKKLIEQLDHRVPHVVTSDFNPDSPKYFNVVCPEQLRANVGGLTHFPLVGQFVSLYFPMGHIKSTTPDDHQFVEVFSASSKWLRVLH